MAREQRRLAAIVAADVVGYARLDPDLRLSNLKMRIGPLLPGRFAKYAAALRLAGVPD